MNNLGKQIVADEYLKTSYQQLLQHAASARQLQAKKVNNQLIFVTQKQLSIKLVYAHLRLLL